MFDGILVLPSWVWHTCTYWWPLRHVLYSIVFVRCVTCVFPALSDFLAIDVFRFASVSPSSTSPFCVNLLAFFCQLRFFLSLRRIFWNHLLYVLNTFYRPALHHCFYVGRRSVLSWIWLVICFLLEMYYLLSRGAPLLFFLVYFGANLPA